LLAAFCGGRSERDVASEKALHEGHQDEIDDLAGERRQAIARQLPLLLVSRQHRGKGVLPEVNQATVLVEASLIPSEALHDDEAEELPVLVHQLDRAPGHPDEHLFERQVGGNAFQVLKAFKEALLLNQRLQEIALGVEVIVDRRVGDTGGASYVADGRARKSALGEQAE
jgi:hypothetical protein